MKPHFLMLAFVFASLLLVEPATAQRNDTERDILVTFDNQGARAHSTGMSAPYRNRKRYSIAAAARRNADEVRDEFSLVEVDHWPIRHCLFIALSTVSRQAKTGRLSSAGCNPMNALNPYRRCRNSKLAQARMPVTTTPTQTCNMD